jgi:hypothetical protein
MIFALRCKGEPVDMAVKKSRCRRYTISRRADRSPSPGIGNRAAGRPSGAASKEWAPLLDIAPFVSLNSDPVRQVQALAFAPKLNPRRCSSIPGTPNCPVAGIPVEACYCRLSERLRASPSCWSTPTCRTEPPIFGAGLTPVNNRPLILGALSGCNDLRFILPATACGEPDQDQLSGIDQRYALRQKTLASRTPQAGDIMSEQRAT